MSVMKTFLKKLNFERIVQKYNNGVAIVSEGGNYFVICELEIADMYDLPLRTKARSYADAKVIADKYRKMVYPPEA